MVVVVIIGMLVSLLFPAVQAARESARQAKCTNHQKELATAITQYQTAKGRFPGYVNRFGKNAALNWVAVIFPHLGLGDLWRKCRAGEMADIELVRVGQLVCPSDLDWQHEPARLSYVANCGRVDAGVGDGTTPPDFACNGVFHNHSVTPPSQGPAVHVSSSDIRDGAQQTLMLSEHVTPARWSETGERQVGFMWGLANDESTLAQLRFTGADPADPQPGDREPGPGNASSNHPGGVIVTFCDGHTQFLREDVHYRVYQHLMTPNSHKAWVQAGSGINLAGTLGEGDY